MESFSNWKRTWRLARRPGPFRRPSLALLHFGSVILSSRSNCRSCQHCSSDGRSLGWCRLRRLEVHPEFAGLVVCHHWTPCAPELPPLNGLEGNDREQQLELDRALVGNHSRDIG